MTMSSRASIGVFVAVLGYAGVTVAADDAAADDTDDRDTEISDGCEAASIPGNEYLGCLEGRVCDQNRCRDCRSNDECDGGQCIQGRCRADAGKSGTSGGTMQPPTSGCAGCVVPSNSSVPESAVISVLAVAMLAAMRRAVVK